MKVIILPYLSQTIFILIVFDIYSLYFYFNVYLLYIAHVSYIIKRIWYGMHIYAKYNKKPSCR